MARTSANATQLSAALTRAEIAETLLADARKQIVELTNAHQAMVANRNKLFAERELLNEKLALARKLFVEQRAALAAAKPHRTPAQAAYAAGAAERAARHEALIAQRRENSKLFFAAHPDAKCATQAEITAWVAAQAPTHVNEYGEAV